MVSSLLLAAAALRVGLRLRRARRVRVPRAAAWRGQHLRLAKPAIWMILAGFVAGPLSMAFLRGQPPFETVHAYLGLSAALLFAAAGLLGRRLESGRRASIDVHALLGTLAVLIAAVAAVAGFVLLP